MRSHENFVFAVIVSVTLVVGVVSSSAQGQNTSDKAATRLNRSMREAMQRSDLPTALRLGHESAELRPEASVPAYNLACVYAMQGKTTESIDWLVKSGQRGFYFLATATRDADLDSVRHEPGYKDAMALIRQNNDAAVEKIKPAVASAPLLKHLPPKYDASKRAPLIVALHSSGGRAKLIAGIWKKPAAERGAIIVAPQSLTPQGRGFNWGVVEQAEYIILQAIERAKREHLIDDDRIVLTGFSQGASMSFTVALRHPQLIAGVIPVAGFHEQRLTPIPKTLPPKFPRFFIMNGALDREARNNREVAAALGDAGGAIELRIYEGIGHGFPNHRTEELRKALAFVLPE